MGSINKSHNESDGGVVLFAGELILIYCDAVTCEIGGKESVRLYPSGIHMQFYIIPKDIELYPFFAFSTTPNLLLITSPTSSIHIHSDQLVIHR